MYNADGSNSGFRAMWWDPIVIVLMGVATYALWDILHGWSWVGAYVLGNFFLFCNVFRVRPHLELIWATTFVLNAVLWILVWPSLTGLIGVQTIITMAVLGRTILGPGYRGVAARTHKNSLHS